MSFRENIKYLQKGVGFLRNGITIDTIFDFVEPMLTPENIVEGKDKLVDFFAAKNKEYGAPLVVMFELTNQGDDVALTILKRTGNGPVGLEVFHRFFLSQLTPEIIASFVSQLKKQSQPAELATEQHGSIS